MAVRFDAANDRVTWQGGTGPTPSSGLTVTLWAYVSVDRDDFSSLIRFHANSGGTTIINCANDSGGMRPCIFTVGGTSTGPQMMNLAEWTRLAFVINGSNTVIYMAPGASDSTTSTAGTVGASAANAPTSGYTLAGRSAGDSTEWYNGRLAHVRLWTSVLTQTEIQAEWASATPVRTSLLYAAYPLSGVGDLLDTSGSGRHLTAGSTAVTTEDGPPISTAISGTSAAVLPPLSASASGTVLASGTSAVGLPSLTSTTAGGAVVTGSMPVTLPPLVSTATGAVSTSATTTVPLPPLSATAAGETVTTGVADMVVPALLASATGASGTGPGTATVLMPIPSAHTAGDVLYAGMAAGVLPAPVAALVGAVSTPATGIVDVTLPPLVAASAVSAWPPAVVDATVPAFAVAGPEPVPWLAVE